MRVLGIDPGTLTAGWGVLEKCEGQIRRLGSGALPLGTSSVPIAERLCRLREEILKLLETWEPECLVVESAYFGRNARSALRLGEARGCVLVTAAEQGVAVCEMAPAQVKRRVAGVGNATKDQVARFVAVHLEIEGLTGGDEADALAVALCGLFELEGVLAESRTKVNERDILPPGVSPA